MLTLPPAQLAAPGPPTTAWEVKGTDPSTASQTCLQQCAHRQSWAASSLHTSWFVHRAMLGCTVMWHPRQWPSIPASGALWLFPAFGWFLVWCVDHWGPGGPFRVQKADTTFKTTLRCCLVLTGLRLHHGQVWVQWESGCVTGTCPLPQCHLWSQSQLLFRTLLASSTNNSVIDPQALDTRFLDLVG